ncbi:MAG: PAS domain S-box protein [Saccharofermentanales bacterium]
MENSESYFMGNRKMKILAIDDNGDNLVILKALINDAFPEAAILFAQNGKKGIEIAAAEEPDVILLDIVMPGMDGFEVCRRLKAGEKTSEIPVVFVTAVKEDKDNRIRALECGAEAFLAKPIDEVELTLQIRAMLKIRGAILQKRDEKKRLQSFLEEKTKDLHQALLKQENIEKELLITNKELKNEFARKTLIIEYQRKLLGVRDIDILLKILGEKIQEIVGDGYTIVSILDEDNDAVVFAGVYGFDHKKGDAIRILGMDPRKMKFYLKDMHDEDLRLYRSGKLEEMQDGIYKLLNRKVPKKTTSFLEKFFQISHVYVMGLTYDNKQLGGVIILAKKDISALIDTIEIIASQSAITMNNIHLEETAKKNAYRFYSLFNNMSSGAGVYKVLNDGSSGKDYIVEDFNQAALQMEKKDITEVQRKSLSDLRPNIDEYGLIPVLQKVWKTGESAFFPSKVYIDDKYHNWYENRILKLPTGEIVTIYDDVTDRMIINEKLEESEKKYRQIAENISDVVWVADLNLNVKYVSPSVKKLFGLTTEEYLKRTLDEKFPPRSLKLINSMFLEEMENEKNPEVDKNRTRNLEIEQYRTDGVLIWISMNISFNRDENGDLIGFLGVSRDISKRKKLEKDLIENEERYRQLFEYSGVGIGYYTTGGVVISYNRKALENLGGRLEDYAGKSIGELFPGELAEMLYMRLEKVIASDQPHEYEDYLILETGSKWFSSTFTRIKNTTGEVVGIQIASLDITDRKNVEEALLESQTILEAAFENSQTGIAIADAPDGKLRYVNKAGLLIRNKSEEELVKNIDIHSYVESWKILHFDGKPYAEKEVPLTKAVLYGESCSEEFIIRRDNMEDRYVLSNAAPIKDSNNNIKAAVVVYLDITERKKAEHELIYLSYHDHLTGLYNRRYFEESLDRLDTVENLPLSIIMGDVNGLKLINDSFGHAVGDDFLKKTAEIIKAACRADDIIARLGGDEFAVILPKADSIETQHVLARIKNLASEIRITNVELSISVGYDTKGESGKLIDETVTNAENEMYKHKIYERSSMRSKVIDIIMNTLFEKSNREMLHSKRVSRICEAIAMKMDYTNDQIGQIRIAGLIHDIGKIGIDEKILNKNARPDIAEWKVIKKHPEMGWRILSSTNEFSDLASIIIAHHEKWDGSGYPNGLKGEEIPPETRIIIVADAYDAMTSERSYRKSLGREAAVEELKRCAGTQFDPQIVDVFLNQVLLEYDDYWVEEEINSFAELSELSKRSELSNQVKNGKKK